MSDILRMKYHPAKKEVSFSRFQIVDGTTSPDEVQIRGDSVLAAYTNKKGSFVLQYHGKKFFEDIVEAFDGQRSVAIEVITTKNDFEDFLQMVEFFNFSKVSPVKISATLLAELPDMDATYRAVKNHGKQAVGILECHQKNFFETDKTHEAVKAYVDSFCDEVKKEINSIIEKINATEDNHVNLCFAGVYSSGKSALINAILGYAVLPEDINAETARMVSICSPKNDEPVQLVFNIRSEHTNYYTIIKWNEGQHVLEFTAGPGESATRKQLQEVINKNTGEARHRQIYEVLKVLNGDQNINISNDITLHFPIPLDNDKVQFTIFDTPGSDSNNDKHNDVLFKALSSQTHSILVFVTKPDGLEGEGNNALLNYIKKADKADSKTSIDLGRSLFVINKADTQKGREEFAKLQISTIKSEDSKSADAQDSEAAGEAKKGTTIALYDKKLFFTSAMVAYAAKAKKNDIATETDEGVIEDYSGKTLNETRGRYYQFNRCATSEQATVRMIELSSMALLEAQDKNDEFTALHICSGAYALENEIMLYGEKYSAAVKAFGIIDSVDKALVKMNTTANQLSQDNQKTINGINNEIDTLKTNIAGSIKQVLEERSFKDKNAIPNNLISALHLNSEYLTKTIVTNPKKTFEKLLRGWFFGLGKTKFSEKQKIKITEELDGIVASYTNDFCERGKLELKREREEFDTAVREIIKSNGDISDEAKLFVCNITLPDIEKTEDFSEFKKLYDSSKNPGKFLWKNTDFVDKDKFMTGVEGELLGLSTSLSDKFRKCYIDTQKIIYSNIVSEFISNIEKYSIQMKALLSDRKAMTVLRDKISAAAEALANCQGELNDIIWRVKEDEQ